MNLKGFEKLVRQKKFKTSVARLTMSPTLRTGRRPGSGSEDAGGQEPREARGGEEEEGGRQRREWARDTAVESHSTP